MTVLPPPRPRPGSPRAGRPGSTRPPPRWRASLPRSSPPLMPSPKRRPAFEHPPEPKLACASSAMRAVLLDWPKPAHHRAPHPPSSDRHQRAGVAFRRLQGFSPLTSPLRPATVSSERTPVSFHGLCSPSRFTRYRWPPRSPARAHPASGLDGALTEVKTRRPAASVR
jgi:hypothetical protein